MYNVLGYQDNHYMWSLQKARLFFNYAALLYDKKEYRYAIDFFNRALKIYNQSQNVEPEIVLCWMNKGICYAELDLADEWLSSFARCLDYYQEENLEYRVELKGYRLEIMKQIVRWLQRVAFENHHLEDILLFLKKYDFTE
jgi:tetratricopeptide (TPR) repeat protein